MSAVGRWLADRTRSASARREADLARELARAEASREGWRDKASTWAASTGKALAERDAARDALRYLAEAVNAYPAHSEPKIPEGASVGRKLVVQAPHLVFIPLADAMHWADAILKELGPMSADHDTAAVLTEVAERLVRDRMRYYGYTDEQITNAEAEPPHTDLCEHVGEGRYDCEDERGRSHHADRDELHATAEWVMWVLEHPTVTARLAAQPPQDDPQPDEREELAQVLADVLDRDEYGTDASTLAAAVLAAGFRRDPDAGLRERVEAMVSAAESGAGHWGTCGGEWLRIDDLRAALAEPTPGSGHG